MTAKCWGYLSRIDGNCSTERYELTKEKYTVGRAEDCDFKISDNGFLSCKHGQIEVNANDKAWFVDQSTNGSLLNLKEKIHKDKCILSNGDIIHLVYRKKEPRKNVAFKFEYKNDVDSNTKNRLIDFAATQMYNFDDFQDFDSGEKLEKEEKKELTDEVPKNIENENLEKKKSKADDDLDEKNSKLSKKIKLDEKVEKKTEQVNRNNDLSDIMNCAICDEIMHDCICLQPCLHSYCAGCYSEWMPKSDECPVCRKKVERISKNHMVNNIIEAYLKSNPEKRRKEEELKELDKKNLITYDMLYPKPTKKVNKYKDDYEDSENDDEQDLKKPVQAGRNQEANDESSSDSDSDSENSDDSDASSNDGSLFNSDHEEDDEDEDYGAGFAGARFGFARFNPMPQPYIPPFNPMMNYPANLINVPRPQPFHFTCRQCPQNKWLNQHQPMNNAPDYTCTAFQNHLLCQCCLEAFPDRNAEIARNPLLPKQNCSMCLKSFCNLYWGCRKGGCRKCLTEFEDLNVDIDCLPDLICENQFETQIFSDWMAKADKTIVDVFNECLYMLHNELYAIQNVSTKQILQKVVCRNCGIKLFRELAYQYRLEIPKNQLNNIDRPNCYYGKNCRTQKHNFEHSKKYNHICEQTKY